MLPPVLEIYVVWHPKDEGGNKIAEEFVEHFHGTIFSGLIGGAIEVYARSEGWQSPDDAPRPVPFDENDLPAGIRSARFIAVVPVLGNELAMAARSDSMPWGSYLRDAVGKQSRSPRRIGIFPLLLDKGAVNGTHLGELVGRFQQIAVGEPKGEGETLNSFRCRDLSQGIAQLLMATDEQRLTVFISHTKRHTPNEGENVEALIRTVRDVISETRLEEFFDASDLQPGHDWDGDLRSNAATSALLALRTDLYPSREWCQREVAIAKREGMPVIIVDALGIGEERGSFLMDHVPRVPVRYSQGQWQRSAILGALNLLVDESLKRVLWIRQAELSQKELGIEVAWWAPHAPEPITLSNWLLDQISSGTLKREGEPIVILHPDPPLGMEEKTALNELLAIGGFKRSLDIMTPRMLAARGG